MAAANLEMERREGVPSPAASARMIPVLALGMAFSLFLVISYLICVFSYLVFTIAD